MKKAYAAALAALLAPIGSAQAAPSEQARQFGAPSDLLHRSDTRLRATMET